MKAVMGLNDSQVEPEGKAKLSEYNVQCVCQAWPGTDWGVRELWTWPMGTKIASLTEKDGTIGSLDEGKVQVRSILMPWLLRLRVPSNVCGEVPWYRLWSLCPFSGTASWRSCDGLRDPFTGEGVNEPWRRAPIDKEGISNTLDSHTSLKIEAKTTMAEKNLTFQLDARRIWLEF